MLGTLITIYLIIGAVAFGLIWSILIASKRRENRGMSVKRGRSESNLFMEPNT